MRTCVIPFFLVALSMTLAACADDGGGSGQTDAGADSSQGDAAADALADPGGDAVGDALADPGEDEAETDVGEIDPALVGSYDILSFTTGGQAVTREEQTTPDGHTLRMTGTLDLAEDGYDLSVDLVIDGDARPSTDSGAWGVDGDRFVLDSDEPESQTLVFTYALEGTTLTLTGVAGSPVEEMILERTN